MLFSREKIGDILQAIYDSEINVSLSWLWDGGVDVCFNDGWRGPDSWTAKTTLRNRYSIPNQRGDGFAEAVKWLAEKAIELYPDSTFAKRWRSGEFANMSFVG